MGSESADPTPVAPGTQSEAFMPVNGPLGWLVFSRAALVFWSLLFLLSVAEVGFRVLGRIQGFDYRLYAASRAGFSQIPLGLSCHWKGYTYTSLCPNFAGVVSTPDFAVAYKTNSRGFRDREYAVEKPAGKTRILALGDSFTFGHGIAYGDRFTDLLESAFDDVELITMAVPGSGHDQQLMQLVYEGLEFHPDHVFVFVTDATLHPWRYYEPLLREGRVQIPVFDRYAGRRAPPTLEERVSRAAARWPLWTSSHALSYLAFRVQRFALLLKFRWSHEGSWTDVIQLPAGWSASAAPTALPAAQVARAEAVFRKLVEIAAADQIEVTFVSIDPNHEHGYLGRLDPRARYLDLGPKLAEEAKRRPLGFEYDAHFNPEANAAIGRWLIDFLSRSLDPGAASRPPSRRGSRRARAAGGFRCSGARCSGRRSPPCGWQAPPASPSGFAAASAIHARDLIRGGAPAQELQGRAISAANPSRTALARTRSSELRRTRSGKDWRRKRALARWMASSVRTGSLGKPSSARCATCSEISRIAQVEAAWAKTAKRSAACASVMRPARSARRTTRRVSISSSREATTFSAVASTERISSPPGSAKSQRSTALVSA
jgi:hypothetical protein